MCTRRESQLCILSEAGEVIERRIRTERARFTAVLGERAPARVLAEACRLGAYRPAHRTSPARRQLRAVLTVREALVRTRARYISVISRSPA